MRKNYYMKNLMTVMLLTVSMSMISCQGFIDAIIGDVDTPTLTTPATIPDAPIVTATTTGAKVETKTVEGVSEALESLVNDIKNKNGGEFKLELTAPNMETSASDFQITVPKVVGSNINIVFDEGLGTNGAPLVLTASEANTDKATVSKNKLTLTLPDASDLEMKLNMPETTITLMSSGTNSEFKGLSTKTALNTLIVDNGVTVKEVEAVDGHIIVKEGGKIDTYVYSPDSWYIWIKNTGVVPLPSMPTVSEDGQVVSHEDDWWDNPSWVIADEEGNQYYIKNLKVIKGKDEYAQLEFLNVTNGQYQLDKLTIADGAAVSNFYDDYKPIPVKTIEGEGNARFLYGMSMVNPNTEEMMYYGHFKLNAVENLSGVAFSPMWEGKTLSGNDGFYINMPPNGATNCSFKTDKIFIGRPEGATSMTYKNCKFVSCSGDNKNIKFTSENPKDETSFELTFDNCEFDDNFNFDFQLAATYSTPFTYTVVFNNCKIGGSAINVSNGIKGAVTTSENLTVIFKVGNVNYTPTLESGRITLTPVVAS